MLNNVRRSCKAGVAVLVLVVTAGATCGGDDDADTTTSAPEGTAALETTPPPETAPPTDVEVGDFANATVVESIVDDFYLALVETDPQAAADLFADDGVFVDKTGGRRVGPAGVSAYVEQVGPGITRCERTGAVEVVDSGSYVFPVEFTYSGVDHVRDVALTMEDDLITLHEWQPGT